MKYDPLSYQVSWRENFELQAVYGWVGAVAVAGAVSQVAQMPPGPFYWMAGICTTMACMRLPQAFRLRKMQQALLGRQLAFISFEQLKSKVKDHKDDIWLGYGFEWENRHAQRVFEIQKRDVSEIMNGVNKKRKGQAAIGQTWIHGVETDEVPLYQPIKHSEGHTLITGTTGSGKTRAFDLLITQAILRNEAVIIIDPKGDKEMRDNARRACEQMGQPERFLQVHPAFPEESHRIDPLYNFSRVTEIASRLASIISSDGFSDPFQSFGWQSLNNLANGLYIIDQRPTLKSLRGYLEGGVDGLLAKAIEAYAQKIIPDWEAKAKPYLDKAKPGMRSRAVALTHFYRGKVQEEHPSQELEGLIAMFQHDTAHFGKMIATLLPIMNMLTSSPLDTLLSPDPSDDSDPRPITDMKQIINQAKVAYIGLDSLTDGVVASALGSILLADLAAVAGDRYNFGVDNRPVNLFVDEAEQIINDPTIQLLNKGRGALFRMNIATQTIPDFIVRLGSKEKAMQVLGNINNTICLRVLDNETQLYMTESLPKTRLKYVMRTQGQNTDSNQPIMHGGNQGERLMEEEADLFPAPLLGMLPNLEYIAKISGGRIMKGRLPILTYNEEDLK